MKIKGAMTVLNRRAQFYGKTLDWLIDAMDNHMDENMTVTQAYEVYKMDQRRREKSFNQDLTPRCFGAIK